MSGPSVSGLGRVWHRLSPIIGLALFVAAVAVLGRELRHMPPAKLAHALKQFPPGAIGLAMVYTALNYLILTGYDQLAFLYIRRPIGRWQIAMASFVGYAIANNVGFALLSGTSARYRFYSRWGLSGQEISRVVLFYSGTFWLGLLVLGGWTLARGPALGLETFVPMWLARSTGWVLLTTALAYPVVAVFRRRPLNIAGMQIAMPSLGLVTGQFVLSALDWSLAAAVLYSLLPDPRPDFVLFVGSFLAAQLIALVSHVPGGLGVFESLMILMLQLPAEAVLPALALFRVVYYLVPLAVALVVLTIDEFYQRRHLVGQWGNAFGTLTTSVTPKLLAVFMMLGGAVLMFSGATPTSAGRLAWVNAIVPLPVIEVSHFVGSLVGFGLLVVAWGLARRLDAAYVLGAGGLVVGIATSLLKGADYEEALVLAALLVALVASRDEFDRKAALFDIPYSTGWIVSAVAVVGASIGLGLFAFRHVEYSSDLWWRFEVNRARRRASFGRPSACSIALALVGVQRLMRPAPTCLQLPGPDELTDAGRVVAAQPRTSANLVFLRDKALLWDEARTAFLMYGIQSRTWVALGDPVGPEGAAEPLVKAFLEECDDYQGVPVFYESSKQWLHVYADFGLTFAKLGEEARVFLPHFALEGSGHKKLRTTLTRLQREAATLRIVEPPEVTVADAGAARGVECLADREDRGRERVLTRLLRRGLRREVPGRDSRGAWPHRGVCDDLAEPAETGSLRGPDALQAVGAQRRDGRPVRLAVRVGEAGRLSVVRPGHGAAIRPRGLAGVAAVGEGGPLRLRPRRIVLQLPGAARLQGEVRSGVGAALPRLSRRPRAASRRHRRLGAHRGRLQANIHEALPFVLSLSKDERRRVNSTD